jgi:hypothetical protein
MAGDSGLGVMDLQLDASVGSSFSLSGANVLRWRDISGYLNHWGQTIAGAYMQYTAIGPSGKAEVTANGSSQFLLSDNNFMTGVEDTWFIVFKTYGDADIYGTLLFDYGDGLYSLRSQAEGGESFAIRDYRGQRLDASIVYNTDYVLVVAERTAGKIRVDYDGTVTEATGPAGGVRCSEVPPAILPTIGVQLNLSTGNVLPGTFGHISVQEVRRYRGLGPQTQINEIKNTLKTKWNV